MLQGIELELATITKYQEYLDHGGRFTYPEYEIIIDALENGIYCPECLHKGRQILDVASHCNLEVTETEVAIYTKLREQIGVYPNNEELFDERARSACCMGDTELIAEIFLLTDETGIKYEAMADRYPHILGFPEEI